MTKDDYLFWVSAILFLNTIPQIGVIYLCFRWKHYPKSAAKRALFSIVSYLLIVLTAFRIITLIWLHEVLEAMIVSTIFGAVISWATTGILILCTLVFEKRVAQGPICSSPGDSAKTSDTLEKAVKVFELEGRKRGWI